jgi:hypothetical protein
VLPVFMLWLCCSVSVYTTYLGGSMGCSLCSCCGYAIAVRSGLLVWGVVRGAPCVDVARQ